MAQTLSVTEVARHPLPTGKRRAELPALVASLPHLSEAEAVQFIADLAGAREELASAENHDPWQS